MYNKMYSDVLKKVQEKYNQHPYMFMAGGVILIIAIIFFVLYITNSPLLQQVKAKAGFANVNPEQGNIPDLKNKIKSMDIMFFMVPTCPYCKTTLEAFTRDNIVDVIEIFDLSTDAGKTKATQIGLPLDKGVPHFISKHLGTGTIGAKTGAQDLYNSLTDNGKITTPQYQNDAEKETGAVPSSNLGERIKKLDVVLFKSNSCGHCARAVEDINSKGLGRLLKIVEVSNKSETDAALLETNANIKEGVPVFYSKTLGKQVIGFIGGSIDKVIDELEKLTS